MYPLLFRTVLSRMDPETAHHAAMVVIRILGVRPFSWAARALTRPDRRLATSALGLAFDSPFGVATGFDKDVTGAEGLFALGFGHVEVGTLTAIPQEGNPRPRLFRLIPDRAVVNRMGFNNHGAEAPRGASRGCAVGGAAASSASTSARAAWSTSTTRPRTTSAAPPWSRRSRTTWSSTCRRPTRRGCADCRRSRRSARCWRPCTSPPARPLLVKIAPDLPDDEVVAVAQLAVDLDLAGLIATNTTISREGS
nr:hypothetical protein GCM10025699_24490 [Microbacterium flavescens]